MISILLVGFCMGLGVGVAAAFSYDTLWRKRQDAKLKEDNEYLRDEVERLRAQVALHINDDALRARHPLVAYQEGQHTVVIDSSSP